MVADQSSTNPIYRPLHIPYDYGWHAFKFVNPLVTRVTYAACCSPRPSHFLLCPAFWIMSGSESPEPLMPARALAFAVAHRTTGDGVKKHTMHARRVRLARRRVRLVDSFDRHCNDWRYGTRSVQESYHGRGKERHEAEGLLAPVLPRGLFRRTSRLGPLLTLTVVLSAIRLSFPTTTLAFLILDKEVH